VVEPPLPTPPNEQPRSRIRTGHALDRTEVEVFVEPPGEGDP
jgi:hypothetical protein